MALPLLIAAGAGILGGGRFLMEKQADRQASERSEQANSMLAQYMNGPGAVFNQADPATGQAAAIALQADPSQIGSILAGLEAQRTQLPGSAVFDLNQQQQQMDLTVSQGNELEGDWTRAAQIHQQGQLGYQQFINTIQSGNRSDFTAATISLAKLLDPTSIVRPDEAGQWEGTGSVGQWAASMMNKLAGDAPTPAMRQQLLETGFKVYKPYNDNLQRLKGTFNQRILDFNNANRTKIQQSGVFGGAGLDLEPVQKPARIGPGERVDNTNAVQASTLNLVDEDPFPDAPGRRNVRNVRGR